MSTLLEHPVYIYVKSKREIFDAKYDNNNATISTASTKFKISKSQKQIRQFFLKENKHFLRGIDFEKLEFFKKGTKGHSNFLQRSC